MAKSNCLRQIKLKTSRSLKKDGKSVLKVGCSGAKAAEYVDNLVELHKLQGVLLLHLQKEFAK